MAYSQILISVFTFCEEFEDSLRARVCQVLLAPLFV
jgi:hypothetical protein